MLSRVDQRTSSRTRPRAAGLHRRDSGRPSRVPESIRLVPRQIADSIRAGARFPNRAVGGRAARVPESIRLVPQRIVDFKRAGRAESGRRRPARFRTMAFRGCPNQFALFRSGLSTSNGPVAHAPFGLPNRPHPFNALVSDRRGETSNDTVDTCLSTLAFSCSGSCCLAVPPPAVRTRTTSSPPSRSGCSTRTAPSAATRNPAR